MCGKKFSAAASTPPPREPEIIIVAPAEAEVPIEIVESTAEPAVVDVVADMTVINPFDFFVEAWAEHYPFRYPEQMATELAPYLVCAPELRKAPLFQNYLASIDRRAQRTVDFLVGLNQRLQQDIGYLIRLEPGVQTPEESLQKRSGSCRDSARRARKASESSVATKWRRAKGRG